MACVLSTMTDHLLNLINDLWQDLISMVKGRGKQLLGKCSHFIQFRQKFPIFPVLVWVVCFPFNNVLNCPNPMFCLC